MSGNKMISLEHVNGKGRPIGESFDERARRAVDTASGVTRSWGRALVESEPYKKNIANLAGRRIEHAVGITVHKPAVDEIKSVFEATSGNLVVPDRQYANPAPLPRRRPRVRDLLFAGNTTSSLVEFLVQTSRTNAAAPVVEGNVIPQPDAQYEVGDASVGYIGAIITVSRQLFDDGGQVIAAVDGELTFQLENAEDDALLNGPGGNGYVEGLLAQASAFNSAIYAIPSPTDIDVIGQALAQAATTEILPDGIILNSLDWQKMQTLKDGEGRYLLGSPYRVGPPNLFGVPVVPTMAMGAGQFVVGAFQEAATFFERQEVQIEISLQDQADFQSNWVKLKASERGSLAVKRPEALIKGALPS